MGNRHGGEKATKEEKEEKRRKKKEKKANKKKQKKKAGVAGSDVDLDPESSQFSHAESESLVFHSAENLSPYLDASTRSEEGAACEGFYDNGHILSSKDFQDGFSIEACLPADLAASALMSDLTADASKVGDDVTSMASGVYSTPLLSSPDVRRGIPRSPLAQRQQDSFVEPVPPIPSDFSSNTLSSVSYQEGVSTPGTQRSSSRASSSTVDTNAAHCIERLEELERNIERTIIEKFAPIDPAGTSSENTTPRLIRRADFSTGDRSREGSVTPKGATSDGGLAQSPETSPAVLRKISEPCRPTGREGSCTPVGVIHGVWSQSAENSPVIVRKALPNPESPIILRRTPSQSPSVERKFPANAPESPVFYRRTVNTTDSPGLSPSMQRRLPAESQQKSPQLVRRGVPELEPSGAGTTQKSKVPPPVPPKPVMKTLTSPEIARRLQNMPKSPIMARKVYAFQEPQSKEKPTTPRDDPWERWREFQMPPKSPSRSPEVRHRVTRKTPSSSPSPKSLVRKLMPPEDRAPPPVNTPPSPLTQVQFCQQQKGIPVKHCTVGTQPSAAVMLDVGAGEDSVSDSPPDMTSPPSHTPPKPESQDGVVDKNFQKKAVSEDSIKKSTETAVFGSVSPKLKRQKKIKSGDESSQSSSLDPHRGDSTDSSTRSPPCSPPLQRGRPGAVSQTSVKDREASDTSPTPGSFDIGDLSPDRRRAYFQKRDSNGTLSSDIAGGLTYHVHFLSDDVTSSPLRDPGGELADRVQSPNSQQDPTSPNTTTTTRGVRTGHDIDADLDSSTPTFSHTAHPLPHSLPAGHELAAGLQSSSGAVIPDSTVIAAKHATTRETGGYTGTTHFTAKDFETNRACWRESEQQRVVPSTTCQHNVPSSSSSSHSSPCTGAKRGKGEGKGEVGGRGDGGGSSSSRSGGGGGAQALRTNLGQRIRDVINESSSSSFREVFTAELSSSSSVEREDGAYYTSDDSVFTHGASSHPHTHHPPPHSTTSPHSSPSTQRAVKGWGVKGTAGHATTTTTPPLQSSNPRQPSVTHHGTVTLPLQSHAPGGLDSFAIRRIDIDVNVILPEGGNQEGGAFFPPAGQNLTSGSPCSGGGGGGQGESDRIEYDGGMNSDPGDPHSSHAAEKKTSKGAKTCVERQEKTEAGIREAERVLQPPPPPPPPLLPPSSAPTPSQDRHTPVMEATTAAAAVRSEDNLPSSESVKNASSCNKGEQQPSQGVSPGGIPPPSLPTSALNVSQQQTEPSTEEQRERKTEASSGEEVCSASESKSTLERVSGQDKETAHGVNSTADSSQPSVSTSNSASAPGSTSAAASLSSQPAASQANHHLQGDAQRDRKSADLHAASQAMTDTQPPENALEDSVPPPSPTAMDMLVEEEEEEEEEEELNSMMNTHQDSDISSKISQEMQMFGETVVKRLSSLLESQASESDSCLEESRTDLLTVPSRHKKLHEDLNSNLPGGADPKGSLSKTDDADATFVGVDSAKTGPLSANDSSHKVTDPAQESLKDTEPVLHEELNTFSTSDLPGERLVTSDTTETLSTDHDTSASSKRESTTSTATDETLTSFKTRSTTDSAEFEDAFILPESLVFVRSVNEGVEGGGAVVETGRIIKRPPIPAELTRRSSAPEAPPHKHRKKRRRQLGSHDVNPRHDVTEPEPKRGSKQIQEVIDAYCEEMSDDSDISSSSMEDILSDEVVHKATYSRSEQQPRLPSSTERDQRVTDIVRKPKPPADRDTDSSEDSGELEAKRRSSSSHDSSFRIPEIEETFGELMGVKTLLEDLEDKPPTSEPLPPALPEEEKILAKEFAPSAQHRRRSKTSPARTDRTESDLDVSEHRDDASTDSMYADDEDEGTEVVFQRSYSEEHGGEVVLSCTIYNSSRDNDADSDEFWADAEAAAASDESYKSLETAADAAGSAFQNARIQMHDIHQHLQDLRRQMEMLQDDITSTSLTLTPEFSLESEQRPVTE